MFNVHLTPKSKNAKTGPIPVSTSSSTSCPSTCAFNSSNAGGCYANGGPLALHWRKVTEGERGTGWEEFCDKIAKLPDGQLWRHNQAGDLPQDGNGNIKTSMLFELVESNKGKKGFTYTHHELTYINRAAIEQANNEGFTINVSANNLDHAVELKSETSAPVVTVVSSDFWEDSNKNVKHHGGEVFVRCPAEYNKDVSCATCGACGVQRNSVIAFTAHGTQKKKASIIAKV